MLENLKLLLNISDTSRDDLLTFIVESTSQRLALLLGLTSDPVIVPSELEYIVVDVSCARYNRIASEGMKSDSVEGESISFYDTDFDPYAKEMTAWLAAQDDETTGGKGKVRFI